ncbi:MAG: chromosome segregation protein SMC [Pseudomonadota bacterium]
MRLSKIKLAGFKSFVDPTTIEFRGDLVGVVGPNGCGKSNVIDAVRWVMGESSASRLRGDHITDVIFNGSSARKPVGTASIELLFDNTDGTVGGQYAGYNEISIKRVVSRDAISTYYLNGAKCRRKDITQIFLGTGLGPRSYSIIEQGMISRLIEARPEDMRVFIEEAAGISKYKERRRETENRIRHTRENLERLTDLLEEVEAQLRRLDRQAKAAERYKKHKATERRLGAELLVLRLADLDAADEQNQRQLAERENTLQASIAEQRKVEASIEGARERLTETTDAFNAVQSNYYRIGAEIARLEQSIEHNRELQERQREDLDRADSGLADIVEHIDKDVSVLEQLQLTLDELAPDLESARRREQASSESLQKAESAMADWQERWEAFNHKAGEAERLVQVENTRIEQLQERLGRLAQRQQSLQAQHDAVPLEDLKTAHESARSESLTAAAGAEKAEQALAEVDAALARTRERVNTLGDDRDTARAALQQMLGRQASLEALQKAALDDGSGEVNTWIARQGLQDAPKLAQRLRVADGWERAVETVLGDELQAVVVDDLERTARAIAEIGDGSLSIMSRAGAGSATGQNRLLNHVEQAPAAAGQLLERVVAADDLGEALALRERLAPDESVITRDGVWVGRDWVRVSRGDSTRAGVLGREQELRTLQQDIRGQKAAVNDTETALDTARTEGAELETKRGSLRTAAAQANRDAATAAAAVESAAIRLSEGEQRLKTNADALRETRSEAEGAEQLIADSRRLLEENQTTIANVATDREALESQRETLRAALARARSQAEEDRQAARDKAIRYESRRSSRESAEQGLARMQQQREQYERRREALREEISKAEAPVAGMRETLETQLAARVTAEASLSDARSHVENTEMQLRQYDQQRIDREAEVAEARDSLSEARMAGQETKVRREGLMEQFGRTGFELAAVKQEMPEEAAIDAWSTSLEQVQRKIERLGPINLAAIEEFKEQSERKEYLDAQLSDLNSALTTLENAIRKIDRETRNRFKETYDQVNEGFQNLFPKLFGGGKAYLDLTGDDLLAAGVTVMARPPGKRNSTIHLLSGGEKALTAVALVFAIFKLNPAPFCMLDEVDAPLDDANVGRFCEIVRDMSRTVQFVFISHNKGTMEMADQLMGVTMNEPGVSRLVAVDIDEAVRMAAA